jgi:BirA family biotin operon repressor/biotin-[acetyl-CoA-carboxylase] ligase
MAAKRETRGAPNSRFTEFVVVDETDSTNSDIAKLASAGAPEGTVVIANRQTAGRGRQGRSWFSADGSALAMSWLLKPQSDPPTWGLIPLLTGVAVVETLHSLGLGKAGLKWPNDVLVEEHKLAGILCESQFGDRPSVIVGLGMNLVWGEDPPQAIAEVATSLEQHLADAPSRIEIARLILSSFELLWQELQQADGCQHLIDRYSPLCRTLQTDEISFSGVDGSVVSGRPARIDPGGGLVLETKAGEVQVTAGDVRHRPT